MTRSIRIGTRGSRLARAQAELVSTALAEHGMVGELVPIETAGDRRAPDTAWGEGAFVAAIERALLDGRVDVAVHSAKDVPIASAPDLGIAAYLPRADARDALVVRSDSDVSGLGRLPARSRVGTDSPRRAGFVRAKRPDLEIVAVHGNVDTRLRRLDEGAADALVLAAAGLDRIGRSHRIAERIDVGLIPPAPGQGAIAIQVRTTDAVREMVAALDHRETREAVELERAFLSAMGGGCRSPIGANAQVDVSSGMCSLTGAIASIDGTSRRQGRVSGPLTLRELLAQRLAIALGGRDDADPRPRILVTRPGRRASELSLALEERGMAALHVPAVRLDPEPVGGELDAALADPTGWDRIVVTSSVGAEAALAAMARCGMQPGRVGWVAVGRSTAAPLETAGATDIWMPRIPDASGIRTEWPFDQGRRVLVARADAADPRLVVALNEHGDIVRDVVAYRTRLGPDGSDELLTTALALGDPGAITFASGSAVRGLTALAGAHLDRLHAVPAVCIGSSTASVASDLGYCVAAVAPEPSVSAVAELTAEIAGIAATTRAR